MIQHQCGYRGGILFTDVWLQHVHALAFIQHSIQRIVQHVIHRLAIRHIPK